MSREAPSAETVIACLTPAGTGAVATLAVRGPRAWQAVRQLFRPHSAPLPEIPTDAQLDRVWLGRLGEETTDQVVVSLKATKPAPWVEVHCHGGREVVGMLREAFQARGVRTCSWQDFEQGTSGDRLRAMAAVALADAATARTAAILLDQYHGTLARALQDILVCWDRGDREEGARLLRSVAGYAGVGRHLTATWRLVVAGAPNVGKSSLINALAGYRRCVVAATPGTTRDTVTTLMAVDGWPVELTDTAGVREPADAFEQQGIGLAREAVRTADLCLWLLDASAAPVWPDAQVEKMRFLVNKVDLQPAWDLSQANDAVHISAVHSTGLEELCNAVSHWLVPHPPLAGAAVPFTARLSAQVEEAWRNYTVGRTDLARQVLADLVGP